jgi:hypothetical protein
MRSVTPSGQSCSSQSRRLPCLPVANAGSSINLFGHVGNQQDREESNPVKRLWRPPALPGARSYKADPSCRTWIGTQSCQRPNQELNLDRLVRTEA